MNHKKISKNDPMDKFSKPIKIVNYTCGKLFYMEPRRDPNKPGRELIVTFNEKFHIIPNFEVKYSYYVRYLENRNCSGNHYHEKKQEISILIHGSGTAILEDIETKVREKIFLDSKDYSMLYINSKVAHKFIANEAGTIELVLATNPNNNEDEFKYEIN